MSKPENPPAFSRAASVDPLYNGQPGMTLRDYFAGQALPAVLRSASAVQHTPAMREGEETVLPAIARDAYELADAMLAQRTKE